MQDDGHASVGALAARSDRETCLAIADVTCHDMLLVDSADAIKNCLFVPLYFLMQLA